MIECVADLGRDLKRRPNFVRPFLLACATRSPKYASTAISCLQRLVVTNGLAQETLKDVLDVLRDCSSLGLDVQLKILQALPSLLQNYASQLSGDLLATALHICFLLLASKTAVISNTAAATLQQLVVSVLGKVVLEDDLAADSDFVAEVPIEDGMISVRSAALDAYQLLNDLCLLTEGSKPQFLYPTSFSSNFGLELIESMLSNHAETICSHPEQTQILRARLMPFIIRIISERAAFSTTVRVMRLLPMIFGNMLSVLATECEMVLGLLNHMLDPDAAVLWKRVLCMEVFRGIHAEPALVRSIYAHFDEQEGKRDIIRNHLAIMVRLAAERPSIIGLGQQSSVPVLSSQAYEDMEEQAALQAEEVAGTIGVAMTLRSSAAPGISVHGSNMRVSCIEQLDKSDSPPIPPSYLYSLVLTCMNSFSEGLARFLLPFSIPIEVRNKRKPRQPKEGEQQSSEPADGADSATASRKSRLLRDPSTTSSKLPVNPLTLENNVLYSQICTSASMIEICWPALLAAYSTFFHAALDSENYHSLVRSFQKFSQVAGLLRLSTPRDAFLTTLGKNSVPPAVVSAFAIANLTAHTADRQGLPRQSHGLYNSETNQSPLPSAVSDKARSSLELSASSLSMRNLLCLRALLNLGIALGPVLQSAWSIILETLQQADLVITHVSLQRRATHNGQTTPTPGSDYTSFGDVGVEISAVKIAATRMFESCRDLPDEAFLDIVSSLKGLLRDLRPNDNIESTKHSTSTQRPSSHRRTTSTAGAVNGLSQDSRLNDFVLENLAKLIEDNSSRLLEKPSNANGWDIILGALIDVISTQGLHADLRLKAATTIGDLVSITTGSGIPEALRDHVRNQGLAALSMEVESLYKNDSMDSKASRACEVDIHNLALDCLRSALEQYGDSLLDGWEHVFAIIATAFGDLSPPMAEGFSKSQPPQNLPIVIVAKSPRLTRSAFGSLQLISSDFLSSVPPTCILRLLMSIYSFSCQRDDFNISLTSTTLFWNVSDHIWQGVETLLLKDPVLGVDFGRSLGVFEDVEPERATSSVIWLRLLLLLVEVSVDERPEIRHSALHTIFRILEASGESLEPSDWIVCQQIITLGLLVRNETAYQECMVSDTPSRRAEASTWNETAVMILDDISSVLRHRLQEMVGLVDFQTVWKSFGVNLENLLQRRSLSISTALYTAIEKILSKGEKADILPCARLAWDIWRNGNPVEHTDPPGKKSDNQPALLAYVKCLSRIYHLLDSVIDSEGILSILNQLLLCATNSTPTAYRSDIDSMTSLQIQIVNSLRLFRTDLTGTANALIISMSSFITLAYSRDTTVSDQTGPTFVALSKAVMGLLQDFVDEHVDDESIYLDDSLAEAIRALTRPINLKYSWLIESKDPLPWKKGTTTVVNILVKIIPKLQVFQVRDSDKSLIWREALNSCIAIITTGVLDNTTVSAPSTDQEFDTDAFKKLDSVFVPAFGSTLVTDKLRRDFSEALFRYSIIHEPHPDDLPQPDQDLLECLGSTHIGRTQDLPPSPRSGMGYVLLDKLFDLVAEHDGSPERVRLAQAAAPYLVLRVGIVLKAYILNQPLRGRMPQPKSQQQEMLYVLNKLANLQSEPKAIPDAPGVVSEHKKHLYRIYSLVTRALGVARRNEEMQKALTKIIQTVSADFGV
ncbi:hypothetical protein MMC13_007627 [Lambiella insularis]|nr:hypothetical protein [Lambiella insularis]